LWWLSISLNGTRLSTIAREGKCYKRTRERERAPIFILSLAIWVYRPMPYSARTIYLYPLELSLSKTSCHDLYRCIIEIQSCGWRELRRRKPKKLRSCLYYSWGWKSSSSCSSGFWWGPHQFAVHSNKRLRAATSALESALLRLMCIYSLLFLFFFLFLFIHIPLSILERI
jgi:hypothetical protein